MCISTICNTCACRMASKRFQQFYILYSVRRFSDLNREIREITQQPTQYFLFFSYYQLKEFNSTDHDRSFRQQQLGRTALPSRRVNYYEFRPGSWVSGAFAIYYAYPVRRARDLDHLILLPLVPVNGRGGRENQMKKLKKYYLLSFFELSGICGGGGDYVQGCDDSPRITTSDIDCIQAFSGNEMSIVQYILCC